MVSVAMGASSSSGLAVKGVNSAIRRVASDQNKVRHIMQSKHEWTKVTKKNQWKYVKPIVKKEMKSGKIRGDEGATTYKCEAFTRDSDGS